jgi:GT2 family glycosyltransferase
VPTSDFVEMISGPAGTTLQRNTLLDAAADCDIIVFLDDDFLPASQYLESIDRVFREDADVLVATGTVIADGAKGPGLTVAFARKLLATPQAGEAWGGVQRAWCGYGCNMAVRAATVRRLSIRFDERLALYAWYEDIDFTRRLGKHGKIVRVGAARGVHLGVKLGRTSGRQLGYSQVINCVYLAKKGSYPWDHALRSILRHLAINFVRSFWAEAWVDRRGRLSGNVLAICDICRGITMPERVNVL